MNRWYRVRRIRGAVFLILVGVLALLNQWRILSWHQSWPFFLIVPGVLGLAEYAAWIADARDQQFPQSPGSTAGATEPISPTSEAPRQEEF